MLALLLLMTTLVFAGGPIDKFQEDFSCYQTMSPEWTPIESNYADTAFEVQKKKRFLGKVDQTIVIPNEFGRLQVVAYLLDQGDEKKKFRHSQRVWKYLNKEFGAPQTDDPFWVWAFPSGVRIVMFSTGHEVALLFACPSLTE